MTKKAKKTKIIKEGENRFRLDKEANIELTQLIADLRAGKGGDKQRLERVEVALADLLEG